MPASSRRSFVTGVLGTAVGVAALGFDPARRSWITAAHAQESESAVSLPVPNLDGALFTDPEICADYAEDFGHIVSRMPVAVLQPGSVDDVVKMVRFCKAHGILVAARGQGHSTLGQAQVEGGLVIDSSTLNVIENVGSNHASVQAGLRWRDLIAETIPMGLIPPVLTGYVSLSIGGTLSMGGVGAASFRYGAQVDNVLELQVVTGDGQLRTCSPTKNALLFNAVRGGVGQYGIIVRAKLRLVPVPPMARTYTIVAADNTQVFAVLSTLTSANKIDGTFAQMQVDQASGQFVRFINAVKFFDPASPPDDASVLAGLDIPASALTVADVPTLDYCLRVDRLYEFLASIGMFHIPHVWSDIFLPGSRTEAFVGAEIASLNLADLGAGGVVLAFPVLNRAQGSAFRLPSEQQVYLFDVLLSGMPNDPNFASVQIANSRALFERAQAIGGKIYPIGSTPMYKRDWVRHYGLTYWRLLMAKRIYDPRDILTPGPGIF